MTEDREDRRQRKWEGVQNRERDRENDKGERRKKR